MQRTTKLLSQLVLVSFVAALVFVPTEAVEAQGNNDNVAEITFDRWSVGSQNNTIVDVEVKTKRAIDGTLVVTNQTADGLRYEYPINAPAQATGSQTVAVANPFGDISLRAELIEDGTLLANNELQANTFGQGTNTAIALFGFERNDSQGTLAVDDIEVGFYPLEDIHSLGSFDTLVAEPSAVRQLGDQEQNLLISWVSVGGQLIVAGEPGAIDEGLPGAWTSPEPVLPVDAGLIRYVGSDWENELTPGLNTISAGDPDAYYYDDRFDTEIFEDAQISLPPLGWLLAVLLLYVLAIGPVLYVVLRLFKKSTLLWIIVPVIAMVVSGGVLGIGLSLVSSRSSVHTSIIEVTPTGSFASTTVLLTDSGEQRLEAPAGWLGEPENDGQFLDTADSNGRPRLEPRRDKTVATLNVASGNVGLLRMQGPLDDYADALTIQVDDFSDTELSGTATNSSGVTLTKAIVSSGSDHVEVGSIKDGETVPFTLETDAASASEVTNFNEQSLWGQSDLAVNRSRWQSHRTNRSTTLVARGNLTVVGWTTELSSPLGPDKGRTALVARTSLSQSAATWHGVRASIISFPGEGFDRNMRTHQFIRSAKSPTMAIQPAANQTQAWNGSSWQTLPINTLDNAPIAISEELWLNNTLYLREPISEPRNQLILVPGDGRATQATITPGAIDLELQPEFTSNGRYTDSQFLPPGEIRQYQLLLSANEYVTVNVTPSGDTDLEASWQILTDEGLSPIRESGVISSNPFFADITGSEGTHILQISNPSQSDNGYTLEITR